MTSIQDYGRPKKKEACLIHLCIIYHYKKIDVSAFNLVPTTWLSQTVGRELRKIIKQATNEIK